MSWEASDQCVRDSNKRACPRLLHAANRGLNDNSARDSRNLVLLVNLRQPLRYKRLTPRIHLPRMRCEATGPLLHSTCLALGR